MKAKLFKLTFVLSMAVFTLCFLAVFTVLYGYCSDRDKEYANNDARFIASGINKFGIDFIDDIELSPNTYVVIADENLKITYQINAPDNVIVNAGDSGFNIDLNNGHAYKVYAYKTKSSFSELLSELFYMIIAVFNIVILISILIAFTLSSKITDPINKIDLETPDERDVYVELQPLIQRIKDQNKQIHKQLCELNEEHAQIDKLRQEFTANVSHELKTPLTSISGYAEIMSQSMVAPEDVQRFSCKIYDEAQRLISLVGDIIKLSQLDNSTIKENNTQVDLYDVCSGIIKRLENAAEIKNITFSITGEHTTINGSERILNDIVYNLCDNAVKYNIPDGKVYITIEESDENVTLSVADTGIGIPSSELQRIFERFYRVDKSHSKELGGTGLGLSIVKHGAAYHKATIDIESVLEHGTKISIIFPK